jgi:Wax ester synthase/diacylglycerol acyltransferase catalytic domain/WS/DGAT C-terminal domain
MNAKATITRVPVPDLCCLWAETPAAPMHMALIGVLDQEQLTGDGNGGPDDVLRRVRQAVQLNLHRAPLLRQVLHATRFGEGGMVWVDDLAFEIARHVVLACPPAPMTDDVSFPTWCAQRSVLPLDRRRPLWRMDVVPGLPGGRVGVLVVLHHVVADGLRGVELVSSLLDPVPRPLPGVAPEWHPQLPPSRADLVRDNVRRRAAAVGHVGVRWARGTASSHINLYVTNVPGPEHPLYLAGARLLEAVPLAPLVAGVRLSVAALSYDGQFVVTLLADDGLDGLPLLAEGLRSALSLPTPATTGATP